MNPSRDDYPANGAGSAPDDEPALRKWSDAPAPPDRRMQPRDRRMQLRAYNHWASMLERRRFPTVADLASGALSDIAPHSVLLDLSTEADGPVIAYLGKRVAGECGAEEGALRRLSEAPDGSLLARLVEHFPTVLVNRAPTGFESDFAGLRGTTVLYRGILLPFSSDDARIDFVLAVINWRDVPRAQTTRQPPRSEERSLGCRRTPSSPALLTDWADGPGCDFGGAPEPLLVALAQTAPLPEHTLTREEVLSSGEAPHLAFSVALAESLHMLPAQPLAALPSTGAEFALAMIRRSAGKPAALLGEVPHDPALIEQAARRLVR